MLRMRDAQVPCWVRLSLGLHVSEQRFRLQVASCAPATPSPSACCTCVHCRHLQVAVAPASGKYVFVQALVTPLSVCMLHVPAGAGRLPPQAAAAAAVATAAGRRLAAPRSGGRQCVRSKARCLKHTSCMHQCRVVVVTRSFGIDGCKARCAHYRCCRCTWARTQRRYAMGKNTSVRCSSCWPPQRHCAVDTANVAPQMA